MSIFSPHLLERAQVLMAQCIARGDKVAVAESCTGGLLSALLTELPGSSAFFTHGFVTYANEAKIAMLGVDGNLIPQYGAVSEQVARAMAQGALAKSGATLAAAITGIAGPGGGSAEKPVGVVHIAFARGNEVQHQRCQFTGDRAAIRLQAVETALAMLLD